MSNFQLSDSQVGLLEEILDGPQLDSAKRRIEYFVDTWDMEKGCFTSQLVYLIRDVARISRPQGAST